jgi:hypothetical protein
MGTAWRGTGGQATVFPQAIGLAATFDVPLMGQVATTISDEARAKHRSSSAKARTALPGADLLVAERQHLPRPALGPRTGNMARTVPHRAHGRGLRTRPAGRRPRLPQAGRHRQASGRAQRAGGRPPSLRCGPAGATCDTYLRHSRRWSRRATSML